MSSIENSSGLVACLPLLLAACVADVSGEPIREGTLELALTSIGFNGSRYALAGTFELVGPETVTRIVRTTDENFATEEMVTLNPRVGTYQLALSDWQLVRVLGPNLDTELVTGAVLIGATTQTVEIRNGQTTNVVYEFAVPGSGVVMFARGALHIDFAVARGLAPGAPCMQALECESHVCLPAGACGAPSCSDGVQNGAETSPDCGGPCSCAGQAATCGPATCAGTCIDTNGDNLLETCQPVVGNWICNATTCAESCIDLDGDVRADVCGDNGRSHGTICDGSPDSCADGLQCFTRNVVSSCLGFPTTSLCEAASCTGSCVDANGEGTLDTCKSASSCIKINEVAGGSLTFVELYNSCPNSVSLNGLGLYFSEGGSSIALGNHVLEAGGYFVYATADFSASAKDGAMRSLDNRYDGWIVLLDPNGATIDSVGWGTTSGGFEGVPLSELPFGTSGRSAARTPNGRDTDDNRVDFIFVSAPTPDAANPPE